MPTYVYRCSECGKTVEHFNTSMKANRPKTKKCPKCGARCERSFRDERFGAQTDWADPVLSESMGVMSSQVAEHRKHYPDIPMTDTGEIIVKSTPEEKRIRKSLARGLGLT